MFGTIGKAHPRSCTTSRLRCSSVRLNALTAAASATSRLGALMIPRTLFGHARGEARSPGTYCRPPGSCFGVRERDDMDMAAS